jgi:hypothetical protein
MHELGLDVKIHFAIGKKMLHVIQQPGRDRTPAIGIRPLSAWYS